MRFLVFPLMLALLLSGCTGSDDSEPLDADAGAGGAGDDAGGDAGGPGGEAGGAGGDAGAGEDQPDPDAAPPVLQEENVSWLIPASSGCIYPTYPDGGPGLTYGHVDVDEATWGKPFEAVFDAQEGLSILIVFLDATGEYLESVSPTFPSEATARLEGTVPEAATEARLTSCAAVASSATYRAGDIE